MVKTLKDTRTLDTCVVSFLVAMEILFMCQFYSSLGSKPVYTWNLDAYIAAIEILMCWRCFNTSTHMLVRYSTCNSICLVLLFWRT